MVVVLDPALHSAGGHHHSAYLRLRRELATRGVRCRYLVSTRADATLRLDADVRPVFRRCVYGRSTWTHSQFSNDVEATLSDLKRGLSWGAQYADFFVVPCADQVLTLALARYLGGMDCVFGPQLLIWLLYGPHWKRRPHDQESGRLAYECQSALSALAKFARRPADLTLVCETGAMASYYSAITGVRIGVRPGPGLRLERATGSIESQSNVPTILCIGHANAAKGYRLLARAIRRVLHEGLLVRFLIHGNTHDCDDTQAVTTMAELEQLACETPIVSVNTGMLHVEDYQRWMSQADILLMPYDPAVYGASRGSGVLFDAEKLGVPAIAPRQCGFAANGIAEGRIAPIERYNSDGVADAVADAVTRIASLKDRARAYAMQKTDDLGEILDFHLARATAYRPQQRNIMRRAIGILSGS
jgi:glycosyltransferase involved in cell wall biosynthesis